ncbi:MAG TPA: FG-GAP repeat protein [Phycisphaerales bacterium]|nr:FG-GAP repeat protein [Phycisphaerales bacterium]
MSIRAISSMGLLAITVAAGGAGAQQLARLAADDGAGGDRFGCAVAVLGERGLVGAHRDDDMGATSGSAYLIDISDPANPVEVAKLLPADGFADANFGYSVALTGGIGAIGATGEDSQSSGSVYLFDTTTGAQLARVLPADAEARNGFGLAVAIEGSVLLVGSPYTDEFGTSSGSAYLFDVSDPANPVQLAKLLPADGGYGELFGYAVAVSGDTVLIGAPSDTENGPFSGSAYLFDISDPASPVQTSKILPADGVEWAQVGRSVAVRGGTALLGAAGDDDLGPGSGSVYVLDVSDPAQPVQTGKLLAADGGPAHHFGLTVALDGATALVGVIDDDANGLASGAAYLFDVPTGAQLAKLLPGDGAPYDDFGTAVALHRGAALIGAARAGGDGRGPGSAYLFDAGGCAPDLTGDGAADSRDVIAFLRLWASADAGADWNGDGAVNTADVTAFLNEWAGGC